MAQDDNVGNWLRPGMGSIYGMGIDQGGGGGVQTNGGVPMLKDYRGRPFTGSWEEYLAQANGAKFALNPTNHMGGSTPGWDEAIARLRKQREIQNSPGMQGFFNAVNNPNPLESVGRQGVSFQGMGQQGDTMRNQLAVLLGRK